MTLFFFRTLIQYTPIYRNATEKIGIYIPNLKKICTKQKIGLVMFFDKSVHHLMKQQWNVTNWLEGFTYTSCFILSLNSLNIWRTIMAVPLISLGILASRKQCSIVDPTLCFDYKQGRYPVILCVICILPVSSY